MYKLYFLLTMALLPVTVCNQVSAASLFAPERTAKVLQSQNSQDEVTLVVSSDGQSKDEAVKTALRSAIEQAYGTFVSANTTILNDNLVKDEIISVSSGNIKEYKEISSSVMPDGKTSVTLQATVSVSKLISYAKSKGAETEFAGATFAMNIKMKELNKVNEEKAIENMLKQIDVLLSNGFDYSIEVGEPTLDGDYGVVTATIEAVANENSYRAFDIFFKTVESLALAENEAEEYGKLNIPIYTLYYVSDKGFRKIPLTSLKLYRFRSNKSIIQIANFFSCNYYSHVLAFTINNNLRSYKVLSNKTKFSRKLYSVTSKIIGTSNSMTPKSVYELYEINCSVKLNKSYQSDKLDYIDRVEQLSNMPISGEISEQRNYYEDFRVMENNRGLLLSSMLEYNKLTHEIIVSLRIPKDDFMRISKFTVQPIN